MPEITTYRQGVPSWIDVSSPDAEASGRFYATMFGWELGPDLGPDAGGYRMLTLRGHDVAGLGPQQPEAPPAWSTYVAATDAEAVVAAAAEHGGTVVVAPMDLPNDSGRIAFVVDPTGAFVGIHQAGPNHIGSTLVNEVNAPVWHELNTRDADAAAAFYGAVFGVEVRASEGTEMDYREFKVDGRTVAGLMPMGDFMPAEVPPHWLVYVAVDDTPAAVERCTSAGGSVTMPTFDSPVGPLAILADPFGATFAVGTFGRFDDPNA
jgi:hypothetical protein